MDAATAASAISGDPASTGRAMVAPQTSASPGRKRARARSAAQALQGIQAAPPRWFQRLTSDTNGPPAIQVSAPRVAADRDVPSREHRRYRPHPDSRKWAGTYSV